MEFISAESERERGKLLNRGTFLDFWRFLLFPKYCQLDDANENA